MVVQVQESGEGKITKVHKNLEGNGYVHYLDIGDGITSISICQNLLNCSMCPSQPRIMPQLSAGYPRIPPELCAPCLPPPQGCWPKTPVHRVGGWQDPRCHGEIKCSAFKQLLGLPSSSHILPMTDSSVLWAHYRWHETRQEGVGGGHYRPQPGELCHRLDLW